ncbi:MAG: phosphatase PAP2 family protein [Pontixanthobacter sp.]
MLAALCLSALVLAVMMASMKLSLDISSGGAQALCSAVFLCGGIRYHYRSATFGRARATRDFAEYTGIFIIIALLCATASYPIAAASQGFTDPLLARLDGLMYFNWLDWYQMVAGNRMLQIAGRAAYANIYFSPLLLIATFAITGERSRAEWFLISFWLGAIMTLLLFLAMPAVGPLSYLWDRPIPYMPTSGTFQADLLPPLRGQIFGAIDLGNLQGLVCAPSFHTTSAILYIAAAWKHRLLHWPVLALNLAMLVATPVEGTHYLTDMIGGAGVAFAALVLIRLALGSPERDWSNSRHLKEKLAILKTKW